MDWLPAVMEMLRAELPATEVVIHSQDSPELAAGLMRGKIDMAFLRPEKQAPGLKFRLLRKDPLIVVMPRDHALAAREFDPPAGYRRRNIHRRVGDLARRRCAPRSTNTPSVPALR